MAKYHVTPGYDRARAIRVLCEMFPHIPANAIEDVIDLASAELIAEIEDVNERAQAALEWRGPLNG